jgi:serine/threonine protein kinase
LYDEDEGVMNELAGQSLGGYYLEKEIGRGSMGVVYRGKQIALNREVAIKVLPQAHARDHSYIARFIREAQIIAGLNHPNIVQIYDAGQLNKLLYFVMEYVQGPTLASLLQLDGTITQHLAVEYAAQIADALHAAYSERHVIHRDIKPENLMLNRWGKMKVMDFGLARARGSQRITMAKTLVGSIYYASPEQIWGETLDNRSDIYALGVVLYEMVTGQRPFTGRSMPELTQAIISGTPKTPRQLNPEIPSELEQIIWKALAKDRNQRYEDAGLMAQSLRTLCIPAPTDMYPTGPLPGRQSYIDASQPLASTYVPRGYVVTHHPPKRPLAQRPVYLDTSIQLRQQPSETILSVTPLAPEVQPYRPDESTRPLTAISRVQVQPSRPLLLPPPMQSSQSMRLSQSLPSSQSRQHSQPIPLVKETQAVQIWTPPDRRSPWNILTEWLRRLGLRS